MRLSRLSWLIGLLLTALVLALAGRVLLGEWQRVRQMREALATMERLDQLLLVAELASRERGPANGVLGDDVPGGSPDRRDRLIAARQRTDLAMAAAQALLVTPSWQPQGLQVEQARQRLTRARSEIDAIAQLPRAQRAAERIHAALVQMFSVIDDLAAVESDLVARAGLADPARADVLAGALLAAEMREMAGQLGSQFTVALTTGQPLREEEHVAIEQLRGRIEQLRRLLMQRTRSALVAPAVQEAVVKVQQSYFERAIPFVESLASLGLGSGHYPVDTAGFAARYVPDMDEIVALRHVLMDAALSGSRQQLSRAVRDLAWQGLACVLVLGVVGFSVRVIQRRVVRPLTDTTELIVALARGDLERTVPMTTGRDEVADMLRALGVLRDNSRARQTLEQERQRLVDQLRDQSNTDFLTGLPNRRGFFAQAEPQWHTLKRQQAPMGMVMFDVDHFKRVNDQHGHAVGDLVLTEIGRLCRELSRRGDVLARYGGEEFLLLMPNCGLDDAARHAERLREAIAAMPLTLPDGRPLQVTASFGVAPVVATDTGLVQVIDRVDDLLYDAKHGGRNRVRTWRDPSPPPGAARAGQPPL